MPRTVRKQRPIKRLNERFDPRRARPMSDPAWDGQLDLYRKAGIDPHAVAEILRRAATSRWASEELLAVRAIAREEYERGVRLELARKRALKAIEAAIPEVQDHPELFKNAGALLQKGLKRLKQDLPDPPAFPKQRPGEIWLPLPTRQLAELLRSAGQSKRAAARIINKAFALAGHDDVVNEAKIKRLLRPVEWRKPPQSRTRRR